MIAGELNVKSSCIRLEPFVGAHSYNLDYFAFADVSFSGCCLVPVDHQLHGRLQYGRDLSGVGGGISGLPPRRYSHQSTGHRATTRRIGIR